MVVRASAVWKGRRQALPAKRENSRGRGAVTRALAPTRTVTIPFYFPRSLVSLAQVFDFYFYLLPLLFLHPGLCLSETIYKRSRVKVYLNVFHDRVIRFSYCSAFSIEGFDSLRVAQSRPLFIQGDGYQGRRRWSVQPRYHLLRFCYTRLSLINYFYLSRFLFSNCL